MRVPFIAAIIFALISTSAGAIDLAFSVLTDSQTKDIVKEFSANFTQTSVSGAAPLGDIFGFQFGVLAGAIQSNEVDKLVHSVKSDTNVEYLPHASLLAMASVPMGFTFEGNLVPTIGGDGFKFNNLGLATKWTLNNVGLDWPFNFAIKAHFMQTKMSFEQEISSVKSKIEYDNTVMGLMALASWKFIVEPYVGVGVVQGKGKFDVSGAGSGNFFADGSTTKDETQTGMHLVGGVDVDAIIAHVALEYSNIFGVNKATAKLAFGF